MVRNRLKPATTKINLGNRVLGNGTGGHYETDADIYVYYCSKFGTDNLEALLSYKFANVVDFT